VTRTKIDATKLPRPTFQNERDARCSKDKVNKCPMIDDLLPDKYNGCNKCRQMKATWEVREELVKRFGDNVIANKDYYDFLDNHPEEEKYLSKISQEYNFIDPSILYAHVKNFGSYKGETEPIILDPDLSNIKNGRHRIRIAQLLGLEIYIHTKE
jgi:hypothetical protein